jgi:hypothetical protein
MTRRCYLPDFLDSAAARSRNFAMVAAEGSFRLPLLLRRLVFVT